MADNKKKAMAEHGRMIMIHWTGKQRFMVFCKSIGFRGHKLYRISKQYQSFLYN